MGRIFLTFLDARPAISPFSLPIALAFRLRKSDLKGEEMNQKMIQRRYLNGKFKTFYVLCN